MLKLFSGPKSTNTRLYPAWIIYCTKELYALLHMICCMSLLYILSVTILTGEATSSSDPNVEQVISDNLVLYSNKRIGSGAFGVVFEGRYNNTSCAVKVLHHVAMLVTSDLPTGEGPEKLVRSFEQEIGNLKQCQHKNVVQFLAAARHPKSGGSILVTELMDCSLRAYLKDAESLTTVCEVSLSKDIASGLEHIHSLGIIHCDLCGDNILLKLTSPIPVAKISDFGMSQLYDHTQMSTNIGHRTGYLPPEALRFQDEEYNPRLDVFCLGAIMVQIVRKLQTVKSAKDRDTHLSQISHLHILKPLMVACLQEDVNKRPTAKDVKSNLQECMFDFFSCSHHYQFLTLS